MKKTFNPEFLNRVDDAIVFHQLGKEEIASIIDIELKKVKERLEDRDIQVRITQGAKNLLAEKGFDQTYGARYLKRAIQKLIEDPLAEEILQGRFSGGSRIRVTKKGDALVFDDERESTEISDGKKKEVAG